MRIFHEFGLIELVLRVCPAYSIDIRKQDYDPGTCELSGGYCGNDYHFVKKSCHASKHAYNMKYDVPSITKYASIATTYSFTALKNTFTYFIESAP